MQRIRLLIALGAGAALLCGCEKEPPPQDAAPTVTEARDEAQPGKGLEDLGQAAGDMGRTVEEKAKDAWASFRAEAQDELKQAQAEFAAMRRAARNAADEQLDDLLSELERTQAAARQKLAELEEAGEAASDSARAELDQLMGEIADLMQRATARMQELDIPAPGQEGGGG